MKNKILGSALIIIGVLIGLYVGGWLMFIGGIVQIIKEVRAEELSSLNVGIGVVRIIFAAFIGQICAYVLIIPGNSLLEKP